jgi:2-oxoglutarate ferredoxin oxidoreductase subunit gamma
MVSNPKLLMLMSQEAFNKYGSAVAEGAQLIVDTDLVESASEKDWLRHIPATRMAEELGNRMVANVIMLSFLCATTGVVSREALEESIRTTVRPALVELNLQAFSRGSEYVSMGAKA